ARSRKRWKAQTGIAKWLRTGSTSATRPCCTKSGSTDWPHKKSTTSKCARRFDLQSGHGARSKIRVPLLEQKSEWGQLTHAKLPCDRGGRIYWIGHCASAAQTRRSGTRVGRLLNR